MTHNFSTSKTTDHFIAYEFQNDLHSEIFGKTIEAVIILGIWDEDWVRTG